MRVRASASASSPARLTARRRVGDDLGQHRVVEDRHLRAVDDAGVDPDPGPSSSPNSRCRVGDVEAVHRPGLRLPVLGGILGVEPGLDRVSPRGGGSGSRRPPSATCSCSSTRSRPVVASVTGCSTCRRVFISRKKNVAVLVGHELDGARAGVADRARPPAGRRRTACRACPECVRRAATAPPR